MKTLILLRHAKSSWNHAGLSDFDRPLAPRGLRDAPRMAKRLKHAGAKPDVLFTSPAARALATAGIFAEVLQLSIERVAKEAQIYEASASDLLDLVRGLHDSWQTVMFVGHNPGFTQLARQFSVGAPGNIVTCGWIALALPAAQWQDACPDGHADFIYDFPKNPSPTEQRLPR